MRSVVGGDDLDRIVEQCFPELSVVCRRLNGGIGLDQRSQISVILRVEEQMVRADLGGDELIVIGQQPSFRTRRHV